LGTLLPGLPDLPALQEIYGDLSYFADEGSRQTGDTFQKVIRARWDSNLRSCRNKTRLP
jgi:hypothetical protein